MRLYMYNLRPLIYDNMITFITISVNVCTKRQKSLFNDYGRTNLFIIIILGCGFMEDIIKIDKLCFRYKSKVVFNNLDLKIKKGSFVSIIGPNGSGKTTLIRILTGLIKYDGYINIDGYNLNSFYLKDIRRKIGVVFDNPDNHFVSETVIDDLAFSLENLQYDKEDITNAINEVSKIFKLENILYSEPRNLTNSEKQRVAIASSLIFNPKILILDEALHQLTPSDKKDVLEILKKYQKERNLTIIMITHNLENTLYSDRIVVLNNGNIYLDGSVKDVYSSNKINSLKLDLPFVIKLSNKLINEHIINKIYTNTIDLMEDLWP